VDLINLHGGDLERAGSTDPVYWEYKVEKMWTQTGEHEVIAVLPTPFA
jgi:hypothetical protein